MNIGSLEASGNVNLNEAGRDIKQITITAKIDFDLLKRMVQEELIEEDKENIDAKIDSLQQALNDKNPDKYQQILSYLLNMSGKVVQSIIIKWLTLSFIS